MVPMSTKIRSYTELREIEDFRERFRYLRLHASIGAETFGFDRYLNQRFYTSPQWRHVRNLVIARDRGCDLGLEGFEIHDRIAIHHMNPMTAKEIVHGDDEILDPEFLITVAHRTHNAIHFGDEKLLASPLVVRRPGDTRLW
jgi:hypothetical protein